VASVSDGILRWATADLHLPVLLIGVVVVSVALTLTVRRWYVGRVQRYRLRRARDGETRAARLLTAAGYEIVGSQVEHSYDLWLDGQAQTVGLRADYLAERDGCRYVVEVKTGTACDIRSAATRRQLLEYDHAFDAEGLVLADMQKRLLRQVRFRSPRARRCRVTGKC